MAAQSRLVMEIVVAQPVGVVQNVGPRGAGAFAPEPSERHQIDALVVGQIGDAPHQAQIGWCIEVPILILRGRNPDAATSARDGIDDGVHRIAEDCTGGDQLAQVGFLDNQGRGGSHDALADFGVRYVPDFNVWMRLGSVA